MGGGVSRLRRITVAQGDDLRAIARRELNDVSRWPEIAAANNLALPFVVESWAAEDRLPKTVIWGDPLLVPWESGVGYILDDKALFGGDILLSSGKLRATEMGDLALIEGRENIGQALTLRLKTLRGELTEHPRYGSHIALAVGLPSRPFASLMAATWVFEALTEEPRLERVLAVDADADGDRVRVAAKVETAGNNEPIDLNLVLQP